MLKNIKTTVWFLLVSAFFKEFAASDIWRTTRQTGSIDVNNSVIEVFNNCKCVYYYQCQNNTIITNGENILSPRTKDESNNVITCSGGKFEGEIICCHLNDTTTETRSPDFQNCTQHTNIYRCGTQRTKINVRISSDDNSIDGEFPWITAIYTKPQNNKDWKFLCSGALIHPKVVLTANHYFHSNKRDHFKVILNGNLVLPTIGTDQTDERDVIEIVSHPDYYGGAGYYDGALLILDRPFESTKTNSINTICLPPNNTELDTGRCLVAGWGKGSTVNGTQILKKVELPLVNFNRCQNLLRKTRLGNRFELNNSFMCAGGEKGKDACVGDGGSPLMCPIQSETRYFHAGIVSWGVGCNEIDVPGIYASTVKLQSWILQELNTRCLNL